MSECQRWVWHPPRIHTPRRLQDKVQFSMRAVCCECSSATVSSGGRVTSECGGVQFAGNDLKCERHCSEQADV
jgi:hypothetical protein